jgi:hypothetical protein
MYTMYTCTKRSRIIQGKNHSWIGKLNHQESRTPFRLTHIAARRGAELKHQQQEEAEQGSHGRRRRQAPRASEVASKSPAAQSKTKKLAQVGRGNRTGVEWFERLVCDRQWPPPRTTVYRNKEAFLSLSQLSGWLDLDSNTAHCCSGEVGLFTPCSPVLTQRRALCFFINGGDQMTDQCRPRRPSFSGWQLAAVFSACAPGVDVWCWAKRVVLVAKTASAHPCFPGAAAAAAVPWPVDRGGGFRSLLALLSPHFS